MNSDDRIVFVADDDYRVTRSAVQPGSITRLLGLDLQLPDEWLTIQASTR
jgi:hypothetical protein